MKTALAQTRFKTADFKFNYEQIIKYAEKVDCDLIIFPECDIQELGGKDLAFDEKCQKEQANLYELIADKNLDKAILLGDVLIQDGQIFISEDGFFNICNKTVYVDNIYRDDVICDLYVLAKNKYFVKDTYFNFVDSISTRNDFVFINTVCMADQNIYAGGSFAKNRENELVLHLPVCEEACNIIDFYRPIEFQEASMEELFYKVTTFAIKEYCENTRIQKVLLGLSGGIDSALVAALAADALGCENVLGIMMPSMYSSEGSVTDSVELAQNLGIRTEKHSITPLFENFMDKVAHERRGDLSEENLQARLRALILMFFSNRDGRLLLSTSNKSESAMGFGTLYGDLAGGLNPICDLTKTNVYRLCNYINRNGERIPQSIIDKAPSAELHPGQKDQDRLPPYEILDDIIEMYLEQNKPFEEIYAKYSKDIVDEVVRKIYRFQFKRKQCCLGVRLTERSFTAGVDLPILQRFY
ncbi:NAD(+) synthase [bacterium]|nr:NAD(+) synthase [bacterium]